jgi:hypothetical protein
MPDLCLHNRAETPPGGYKYTQPETGVTFTHYAYDAFMTAIMEHRLGNNIPLDTDWREKIGEQMCKERLPDWKAFCKPCKDTPTRAFSLEAARSFLKFAGTWIACGFQYVDQATADDRAKTCAGCPKNIHAAPSCGACWNSVLESVAKLRGKRDTEYTDRLGSCSLCSCQLNLAIWMPLEQQQSSLSEDTKQRFREFRDSGYPCWKAQNL